MKAMCVEGRGRAASQIGRFIWLGGVAVMLTISAVLFSDRINGLKLQPITPGHLETHHSKGFLREYFPQALACGAWQDEYARLHNDIRSGKRAARYFVSVAVEAGIADRLSGMITQFYLAVVGGRAFTAMTYGDLPPFEAACMSSYVNWTHPEALPEDVVAPLKYTYKGVRGYSGDRSYGPSVDTNTYSQLYAINYAPRDFWFHGNLSDLPQGKPETPYIIGGSNRGRTFVFANNPYHKAHFWRMGLTPNNAFMCGMFFLCSPNLSVQRLYKDFWDQLKDPNALKIGINVRLGESVFKGESEYNKTIGQEMLQKTSAYFECASSIEKAFAKPGQKVIWLVVSDSLLLRKAAAEEYGAKVVTDLDRKAVHPDCRAFNPAECHAETMNLAMVHAIGQLYTFSMADYHILPRSRGFGRLGAWLSGRWNNLYELQRGETGCDPHKPLPAESSSLSWAGV